MASQLLVIHERIGTWARHLRPRLAEDPPRVVRLTHYPDDPLWDDTPSEVDPATGYLTFGLWPGVRFAVPPDCYDPSSWDYEGDRPIPPASRGG